MTDELPAIATLDLAAVRGGQSAVIAQMQRLGIQGSDLSYLLAARRGAQAATAGGRGDHAAASLLQSYSENNLRKAAGLPGTYAPTFSTLRVNGKVAGTWPADP